MTVTLRAEPDLDVGPAADPGSSPSSAVMRGGRVFLGTVLLAAALGLWLLPVAPGDAAMRLIKLLFSASLFVAGALLAWRPSPDLEVPEIRLDTRARRMRIIGRTGCTDLDFDELGCVEFTNDAVRLRAAHRGLDLHLPLSDAKTENAMRGAFSRPG